MKLNIRVKSQNTPVSHIRVLASKGIMLVLSLYMYIGFAANNISETYDAKIFSVATLLSSYLLYNSVKVGSVPHLMTLV
jgi:hypothetical protein